MKTDSWRDIMQYDIKEIRATPDFYPYNSTDLCVATSDGLAVTMCKLSETNYHLCGYCAIPQIMIPKEWHGNFNADALQYLKIHGGITWCHTHRGYVIFGFDCSHAYDDERLELKDPQYVLNLARDMRKMIIDYASKIDEWRNSDEKKRCEILDEINQISNEEVGFGALIGILCGMPEIRTSIQ
jgi:hypothetical protein